MRYRMSDEVLAAETADRQRASQPIRPWASYTDAEKYYLRYGVMPPGRTGTRPTTGDQAIAAAGAQHGRLISDYRARNWDVRRTPEMAGMGRNGAGLSAPPPAQQLTQQARSTAPHSSRDRQQHQRHPSQRRQHGPRLHRRHSRRRSQRTINCCSRST